MARGGLRTGTLVRLFDIALPPVTMYSLAYPITRQRCPRILSFRDWIFDEVITEGTIDHQSRMLAAS